MIKPYVLPLEMIGLDLEKAESGHPEELIKSQYRGVVDELALPKRIADMRRIARLDVSGSTLSGKYIRRVQLELNRRELKLNLRMPSKVNHEAMVRLYECRAMKREAKKDIEQILEGVREEAAKATESLSTLYSMARGVIGMQLKGYLEDKEVNGTKLTHQEAAVVSGKVLTQVAKIGAIDPKEQIEVEDAVMKEYAEDVRKRLEIGTIAPQTSTEPH